MSEERDVFSEVTIFNASFCSLGNSYQYLNETSEFTVRYTTTDSILMT